MRAAAADIQVAAEGFADFVAGVAAQHAEQQQQQQQGDEAGSEDSSGSSGRLGDSLLAAVRDLQALEWMVPPMLQAR